MIPYGHQSIDEEDIKAVADVLRSDWLTQGPKVEEFEKALADYCGASFAIVFNNGTSALQAAYFAADFQPGDEFITSPLTFAATSNAGIWQGGKPIFADIDPETGNIDPEKIKVLITPKTKAIVPIDYSGNPIQHEEINKIAKEHGLIVIEDACHALGASQNGKKVGTLSDMTVFSFHPVKPITTGEGGAVLTDNPDFARRLKLFRTHGITKENFEHEPDGPWYYEMQALGENFRLTDFQCALGLSQLKKLDQFISAREKIALRYDEAFQDIKELKLPTVHQGARSGWHLYPVRLQGEWIKRRREVFEALRAANIGVQVHYIPVHLHPYYQKLGYAKGLCPKAEDYYAAEISLPMFPGLSGTDQDFVIQTLKNILAQ
ncbi:MAG: UDP-4-amino-4,6-dideoxy-N-acetyl-beta-L-altrosamine transaminase [Patescibacteria group bacterium]|jgi:UDP-4-amino-4,6-dideoxy-N-acetyl-beta-L-altrosamine transaminase